jgi:hypothetical protein
MWRSDRDRVAVEYELVNARRRVQLYVPFSPAWDAAMGLADDLEQELAGSRNDISPPAHRPPIGAA